MTRPLRLATYNTEWFDHLFDDTGALIDNGSRARRHGVTRAEQIDALTRVFRALDADGIMVIEAPDASRRRDGAAALEHFAARAGIRARRALIGFANDTQQEITFLYDPDRIEAAHDPLSSPILPRFDMGFRIDLDTDADPEEVRWSKPPLELALTVDGAPLRLIGVHAKSKAPHGARDADHAMRLAIAARRKQLAQCIWLRYRVDDTLKLGQPVIVMGDFNDGPGLDEFEALFGRSGVDIVLGEGKHAPLFDPNALQVLQSRVAAQASTARFWVEGRWLSALLDYIMVSEDLRAHDPQWTIWHPFDTESCWRDADLRDALLHASDHFPVTLDLPHGLSVPTSGA